MRILLVKIIKLNLFDQLIECKKMIANCQVLIDDVNLSIIKIKARRYAHRSLNSDLEYEEIFEKYMVKKIAERKFLIKLRNNIIERIMVDTYFKYGL